MTSDGTTTKRMTMEGSHNAATNLSNSSQKRPAQENGETQRAKRAKYTSAAWYGNPILIATHPKVCQQRMQAV
jgi:hypothetical protein